LYYSERNCVENTHPGNLAWFYVDIAGHRKAKINARLGNEGEKMGLQFLEIEVMQGPCTFYLISPPPQTDNSKFENSKKRNINFISKILIQADMFRRPSYYIHGKARTGGGPRKMTIVDMKWRLEGATNYGATAVALRVLEACRAEKRGVAQIKNAMEHP
jgi:hypothetical protein